MSRDINPFGLRMPPELKAKLEHLAHENRRSLNAEIVARLKDSVAQMDKATGVAANTTMAVASSSSGIPEDGVIGMLQAREEHLICALTAAVEQILIREGIGKGAKG